MSFQSQFATWFSSREKETELYKLWAQIGSNTEKTLLETIEELNAEYTDINSFSEDTARSWLAFFLKKVPYRVTSKLQIEVSPPEELVGTVTVPDYQTLTTSSGIRYTLINGFTLDKTSSMIRTLVQGKFSEETGTYNSLIKIACTNPDLDYLTVKINNIEISPISFEGSYDYLKYNGSWTPENDVVDSDTGEKYSFGGTPHLFNTTEEGVYEKGTMYNVLASGKAKFAEDGYTFDLSIGDMLVWDGAQWGPISKSNNINPFQWNNTYGVPSNGYYAYYYDNYLYIKIFQGTDVEDPTGLEYYVRYLESDGKQGEISEDETIEFDSNYTDNFNDNIITLDVTHSEASTTASNQPSSGKLNLMLQERFFSGINVSSIPEYTAWFKAQPEIGDCIVLSDYEKWVRNGKKTTGFEVTGIVSVYALDRAGNELNKDEIDNLTTRLADYKDIAYVEIKTEYRTTEGFFHVSYSSCSDEAAYQQYVTDKIKEWYDVEQLQKKNASVFENLDLSQVTKEILNDDEYNGTGFSLDAYHKISFSNPEPSTIDITTYSGEYCGRGFYRLYDNNTNEILVTLYEQKELGNDTQCDIYTLAGTYIGYHNVENNVASLNLAYIATDYPDVDVQNCTLVCYLPMSDEGILTIGQDIGKRTYGGIEFNTIQ